MRRSCGESSCREGEATPGPKRKEPVETEAEAGAPEPKTRRTASPRPIPMELTTPTRSPRLSESTSASSDEDTELPDLQSSPARMPMGGLNNRPIGVHAEVVHTIFPTEDVVLSAWARGAGGSGEIRPVFPYPFTGPVLAQHRETVRGTLETAWVTMAASLTNPTVADVSRLIQLATLWRWEQGWRRSRVTGDWLFMGDLEAEDFHRRLATEEEDRSALRGQAMRRMAVWLSDNFPVPAAMAEARARASLAELRRINRAHGGAVWSRMRRPAGDKPARADGPGMAGAAPQRGAERDGGRPRAENLTRRTLAAAIGQALREAGDAQQEGPGRGRANQGGRGRGQEQEPVPNPWAWSRGSQRGGRGRGFVDNPTYVPEAKREPPRDPWQEVLTVMAANPELFEWLHRLRTTQYMLTMAHPNREHISRVIQSEETRSRELAESLLRGQEITGVATLLNITWPPVRETTTVLGRPGLFIPGAEFYMEDVDDQDQDEDYLPPPPRHCRPRRGRGGRGPRGGRGGRGGLWAHR